jgi:hypothetical protein
VEILQVGLKSSSKQISELFFTSSINVLHKKYNYRRKSKNICLLNYKFYGICGNFVLLFKGSSLPLFFSRDVRGFFL